MTPPLSLWCAPRTAKMVITSAIDTKPMMMPARARPSPFWAPWERRIWDLAMKPKIMPRIPSRAKSRADARADQRRHRQPVVLDAGRWSAVAARRVRVLRLTRLAQVRLRSASVDVPGAGIGREAAAGLLLRRVRLPGLCRLSRLRRFVRLRRFWDPGSRRCGLVGPVWGGPVQSSGGYHLPSDASHHPGPCEVSLMASSPPVRSECTRAPRRAYGQHRPPVGDRGSDRRHTTREDATSGEVRAVAAAGTTAAASPSEIHRGHDGKSRDRVHVRLLATLERTQIARRRPGGRAVGRGAAAVGAAQRVSVRPAAEKNAGPSEPTAAVP